MPEEEPNNLSANLRQIMIFCENRVEYTVVVLAFTYKSLVFSAFFSSSKQGNSSSESSAKRAAIQGLRKIDNWGGGGGGTYSYIRVMPN